jgi:ubiquinone/menaquinone biosynthesis C-methylase UbiE
MKDKPVGAGSSSFDLIEPKVFFTELNLQKGQTVLDAACGRGAYSLSASEVVGPTGRIWAFDLWKEGIEHLQEEINSRHIRNIEARVVDVSQRIPLEDHSVDVCLLATVLHDLIQVGQDQGALEEIKRVMKPQGIVAVMEFKTIGGPPGPPIKIRISVEEVAERLRPFSLDLIRTRDVGPYNYLAIFTDKDKTAS